MVVDDSPIIVRKLSMLLDAAGYRVVGTAVNGKEAIAAYRSCKPDAVTKQYPDTFIALPCDGPPVFACRA